MIFEAERLIDIAVMNEGRLDEIPYAVLLYAFARARRSCTLEITRGPLAKHIFFERGVPVECRSNLVTETLSRFMQKSGRLSEDLANECFNQAIAAGVRFGDVLIERGLMSAEELLKVLQQNLAHKLLDGFSWHEGGFRVGEPVSDVDSSLKVNVPQLIVIGVTRFATQAQVDASVGALIGKALALHPTPFFKLEEIKLGPAQQPLVEALKSRHLRIDELAAATAMPYQDLTRLLFALSLVGVVGPAEQVATSPAPSAPAGAKSPPAGGQRPSARDREELMRLALNHRRMDAFTLLDLEETADHARVEQRFLSFAERFAPWQYDDELADKARSVFLAGVRAYTIVNDPARRKAVLERRQSEDEQPRRMPAAAPSSQFRLDTTLLDPDVQFKEGCQLMDDGHYLKAIEQLEYAANLDSQNAGYQAVLAYCRFLHNAARAWEPSLEELAQALRIDPRCGLAMYYTGEILAARERFDEAAASFQKAIKPMAPDRRPIEALRKLKTGQKL